MLYLQDLCIDGHCHIACPGGVFDDAPEGMNISVPKIEEVNVIGINYLCFSTGKGHDKLLSRVEYAKLVMEMKDTRRDYAFWTPSNLSALGLGECDMLLRKVIPRMMLQDPEVIASITKINPGGMTCFSEYVTLGTPLRFSVSMPGGRENRSSSLVAVYSRIKNFFLGDGNGLNLGNDSFEMEYSHKEDRLSFRMQLVAGDQKGNVIFCGSYMEEFNYLCGFGISRDHVCKDCKKLMLEKIRYSYTVSVVLEAGPSIVKAAINLKELMSEGLPASSTENCCVCLSSPTSHAMIPCGHLILCGDCLPRVLEGRKCPVCKQPSVGAMRVYGVEALGTTSSSSGSVSKDARGKRVRR